MSLPVAYISRHPSRRVRRAGGPALHRGASPRKNSVYGADAYVNVFVRHEFFTSLAIWPDILWDLRITLHRPISCGLSVLREARHQGDHSAVSSQHFNVGLVSVLDYLASSTCLDKLSASVRHVKSVWDVWNLNGIQSCGFVVNPTFLHLLFSLPRFRCRRQFQVEQYDRNAGDC
jgi:hypothetical protein